MLAPVCARNAVTTCCSELSLRRLSISRHSARALRGMRCFANLATTSPDRDICASGGLEDAKHVIFRRTTARRNTIDSRSAKQAQQKFTQFRTEAVKRRQYQVLQAQRAA